MLTFDFIFVSFSAHWHA